MNPQLMKAYDLLEEAIANIEKGFLYQTSADEPGISVDISAKVFVPPSIEQDLNEVLEILKVERCKDLK